MSVGYATFFEQNINNVTARQSSHMLAVVRNVGRLILLSARLAIQPQRNYLTIARASMNLIQLVKIPSGVPLQDVTNHGRYVSCITR